MPELINQVLNTARPLLITPILMFLFGCGAAVGDASQERYHRSSDGKTEVVYLFDAKALFKYRSEADDGTVTFQYDLAQAHPSDEPDDPSVTRNKIEKLLVEDVTKGYCLKSGTGDRVLLFGYEPIENQSLSFDEVVKITAERTRVYWVVDASGIIKAKDENELFRLVQETKPIVTASKLMDISDLFRMIVRANQ
jgi:hypothetical protein